MCSTVRRLAAQVGGPPGHPLGRAVGLRLAVLGGVLEVLEVLVVAGLRIAVVAAPTGPSRRGLLLSDGSRACCDEAGVGAGNGGGRGGGDGGRHRGGLEMAGRASKWFVRWRPPHALALGEMPEPDQLEQKVRQVSLVATEQPDQVLERCGRWRRPRALAELW